MAMTLGEFREQTKHLPDDLLVVKASDGEGNSFSPLSDYEVGKYEPETTWSGDFYSNRDIEDCNYSPCEGAVDAVCLWPVN